MERERFEIPIGDWSGDGHRNCEYFPCSTARNLEAVREAYFASKEKFPAQMCPENICSDYQDHDVDKETSALISWNNGPAIDENNPCSSMAGYVVWFINQGDPTVDVVLEEQQERMMLPFYGTDKKNRHIRGIGYGFFWD